jgi:hypothetical protein
MEPRPCGESDPPSAESPEALFDAFIEHPEWDQARCDAELERLVAQNSPDQLCAALLPRLHELGSRAGEPVLRLVEALATPELLAQLAEALQAQPGLAPERAWAALTLLDDAGVLGRYSELAERWEELTETFEEDSSLEQLAAQIEDDAEGLSLALHGLAAVEPEIRAQIITGLAAGAQPPGPNLLEFLRLLSFAHDPATRTAALGALARVPVVSPLLIRPEPRLVHSLVTALDGNGRAHVVLSASDGRDRTSAAFLCDVLHGVPEVFGETAAESPLADSFLEAIAEANAYHILDAPGLADGLLKGCLLLCGPETTPALRYWFERTLGPRVAPHPFPIPFTDWDPRTVAAADMARRAELVLASCPHWIDTSDLTYDIAEEVLLREGDSAPDARRDVGAYRYLFEHRLRGQLELYRRMLLWMASFWQASGDAERGRSALALATQLADEQHAVAGHPFTVALTSRSLAAAQDHLRAGLDPRQKRKPGA